MARLTYPVRSLGRGARQAQGTPESRVRRLAPVLRIQVGAQALAHMPAWRAGFLQSGLAVCQGDPAYQPFSSRQGRRGLLGKEGLWSRGKGDIRWRRPGILEGRGRGWWEPSQACSSLPPGRQTRVSARSPWRDLWGLAWISPGPSRSQGADTNAPCSPWSIR